MFYGMLLALAYKNNVCVPVKESNDPFKFLLDGKLQNQDKID